MKRLRQWLTCRAVSGRIEAYLDGEAPHLRDRIEAHIARCPACRALADRLATQIRALDALMTEADPRAGFGDRVMQRIEKAQTAPTGSPARSPWRVPAAGWSATAALAALAVVLWLTVVRETPPTGGSRVTPAPAVATQPQPSVPAVGPQIAEMPKPTVATSQPTAVTTATRSGIRPAESVKRTATASAKPTAATSANRGAEPDLLTVVAQLPRVGSLDESATQTSREVGRSYEAQGENDAALAAYAQARQTNGSEMARLDEARVYERSGYTAQALEQIEQVAFADVDGQRWEVLALD